MGILLKRGSTVFGLAVLTAFGCLGAGFAPRPLVLPGSVAASYTDIAKETASPAYAPFMAAARRISRQMSEGQSGLRLDGSFEKLLGVKDSECLWSLLTVGEVTLPNAKRPEFRLPDIAFVLCCRELKPQAVIAALTGAFAEAGEPGALKAGSMNGRSVWTVASSNLTACKLAACSPCLTFKGNSLILFATNRELLGRLTALYDGAAPAIPGPLQKVTDLPGQVFSQTLLPDLGGLLAKVYPAEERKGLDQSNPQLALALRTLRSIREESGFAANGALTQVLRAGCANAQDAESISELLITFKTTGKMLVSGFTQGEPALAFLNDWMDRIKVSAAGSEARVTFHLTAADLNAIDYAKIKAAMQPVPAKK